MQNEQDTKILNDTESLIERLRIRAVIRRQIQSRKSVQENKPDKIADLLEEAADKIEASEEFIQELLELL